MRNKTPIICCAYANDKRRNLQLEDEFKAINRALTDVRDNLRLSLEPLPQSNLDDIYRTFNRYHNRIAIFHYAGHSDSTFLQLDGIYARVQHLSVLIGMQQNLKLVFLNGCSNKAQVAELAKRGVKAIIATSAPIEDTASIAFATAFYDALGHGKSIQASFDTAVSKLNQEHPAIDGVQKRGLVLDDFEDELPWGLYADDAADLDWALPNPQLIPEDMDYQLPVPLDSEDCNKVLVQKVFEGLSVLDEEYKSLWQDYIEEEDDGVLLSLKKKVYDIFPSILSTHIGELFTHEAEIEGRRRLEKLRHLYSLLSKLIASIALADLWRVLLLKDEDTGTLIPNSDFRMRAQYKADILRYCELDETTAEHFDYIWLARSIYHFFEENDLASFFPEVATLLEKLQSLEGHTAYHFLEFQLKQPLLTSGVPSDEVVELCKTAELHLGTLLKQSVFLTQYQLVSVNDIQVSKLLLRIEASFIHIKSVLHGNDRMLWRRIPQKRASFTCNRVVVMIKDISTEELPLTLAPFIIDENVYKKANKTHNALGQDSKLPKIYFLQGQTEEGALNYQLAEDMNQNFLLPPKVRANKYHSKELEAVRVLWKNFCTHIKNLKPHE